ncbi:MAG: B12-binding radical protein [Rhodospirillales bacterium]|nr:B12-binding radical protein [Rhodospirillales bacterium]
MNIRQKVVLYNPAAVFHTMPLGLLAIGSNLDPARFDVRIIDARIEPHPLLAVVREAEDAICFGVTMLTGRPLGDALAVLRAVKRAYPALPTIAGGWHPSLFPVETLEEASIDIVVSGQGERSFAELVERLSRGETVEGVAGTIYRDGDRIVKNKPRALESLDAFTPPNFDLIPVERYFAFKKRRQLDYITSIGCNFRCAFCADPFVYGRDWKAASAVRLGEQIETLWRRYRFTDLNFQDETYFTHRDRVAEICEEFLRRGLEFTWAGTLRADQGVRLPDDVWRLCVQSGLRRVLVGVETGSHKMMERIRKDTTVDAVLETAAKCREHDIAVIFSFIVGFPDETEEEVEATLGLIKTLRAMSTKFETPLFYYKPYPGSSLATKVAEEMPGTLEEWAQFDYVAGAAGGWVSSALRRRIERFKFYNRYATGLEQGSGHPLHRMARWRISNDFYAAPIEKFVVQHFRHEQSLS